MSKLTKWKVDENEELPLAVIEDTEEGYSICEIGSRDAKKSDASPKQIADAQLIASAPTLKKQRDDLLTACKGMVSDSEMLQEDEGITACQCMVKAYDIDEPTQCNYCKAKAAIANCE